MIVVVRNIMIMSVMCALLSCSQAGNETALSTDDASLPAGNETTLSADEASLPSECMNMDGVYQGKITNNSTGASAAMKLDVWQNDCLVEKGHILIEAPLFTEGMIRGWVENDEMNFMALDRQRMIILGEELHFNARLGSSGVLSGSFYSLDPQSNVNDEGVWEVVAYNP